MNKMSTTPSKRSYRRLNRTAKLAFYNARQRKGDTTRLAETTGYSVSHVSNIINGRRSVNQDVADAMYSMSRRRMRTIELVG
jgi:hypothetical protein